MKKVWNTPFLEVLDVNQTYKFFKSKEEYLEWWEEYCKQIGSGTS